MVGHMIVMVDGSSEQVGALSIEEGAACDMCGRSWTGATISESSEEDGRVAVLQYLHPDFDALTEEQIHNFTLEHACSQCGDPTEELPRWAAERVLRANPHLALADRYDAICEACARNYFGVEEDETDADQH
jgi:hypothetical protein